MKIGVLKERAPSEKRVAIFPDVVKKFVAMGIEVFIEKDAGLAASITNKEFEDAGAKISNIPLEIIADADFVLKVQPSYQCNENKEEISELSFMTENSVLIGMLSPYQNKELIEQYAKKKISAFSMELLPRISRAQTMDVLSSQNNLAGYKAVLDAAGEYQKAFPMMMTAAGTVPAAKILVMGVGVAGLQAIATAKRLGGIVSASDVRRETKEQVQSLGANFLEVPIQEEGSTSGGYAKEMSEEYQKKQKELIHETIKKSDIVICTALIPGKKAPTLVTKEMVADMKSGSVIVDLAAIAGGNCELTEIDQVINVNGVKIVGYSNTASRIAYDASRLYAKNLLNFIELIYDQKTNKLNINFEDEIVKATLLTHNGEVVHPLFRENI